MAVSCVIRARINWAEGDSRREASVKGKWYDTPEDFARAIHHITDCAPPVDGSAGYMKVSVTLDMVDNMTGNGAPCELFRREITPMRWEMYKGESPERWLSHEQWIPVQKKCGACLQVVCGCPPGPGNLEG